MKRKEAQALGLTKYPAAAPCIHGHMSERYASSGACVECNKVRSAAYNEEVVKTGYPRGRPRAGEVRPPSIHAIKQNEYRKRRHARDPEWQAQLTVKQREWYYANLERGREISRQTAERKKAQK